MTLCNPGEVPTTFAVGLCFTRPNETPKGVMNAFLRTESNGLKVDDLIHTLMAYGLYEGGNKTIMLHEVEGLNLEAMTEELKAAEHTKTTDFIWNFWEESDCTDWCIVVMEYTAPDDEFQAATIDALPQ